MMQRVTPPSPRSGFIELPSRATRPPSGPDWIHEIKHDGYRLMARRDPIGCRCAKAEIHGLVVEGVAAPRNPIVGSFAACCARAASGPAAAAPPSVAKK